MSKTSQYLELAMKIENNISCIWYCCTKLHPTTEFVNMFEPTTSERIEYNHPSAYVWMAEKNASVEEDNNLRILALLFMHEITTNP